jgi:hypothetical protein
MRAPHVEVMMADGTQIEVGYKHTNETSIITEPGVHPVRVAQWMQIRVLSGDPKSVLVSIVSRGGHAVATV